MNCWKIIQGVAICLAACVKLQEILLLIPFCLYGFLFTSKLSVRFSDHLGGLCKRFKLRCHERIVDMTSIFWCEFQLICILCESCYNHEFSYFTFRNWLEKCLESEASFFKELFAPFENKLELWFLVAKVLISCFHNELHSSKNWNSVHFCKSL